MKLTNREREEKSSAAISRTFWLMAGCFFVFMVTAYAAPSWWSNVQNGNAANDYAVANQGQLKFFTEKAVAEMNTTLASSGGAGPALTNLVYGWQQDYLASNYANNPSNPTRPYKPSDYQAINVGQLKYVGKMIWDRLVNAGYTNALPSWLATSNAADLSVANIGQLKTVFNFDLANADSDGNGLPDAWEIEYFGHIGNDPNSSPDGNGYTLLQDYTAGLNPTNYYSQLVDGHAGIISPTLAIVSGDNQISSGGQTTANPLVVSVSSSNGGGALVNAPVVYTVASGGGLLSNSLSSSGTSSTLVTMTDANGLAQIFYQNPSSSGTTSAIAALTGGQSVNFTSSTSAGDGTFDAPMDIAVSYPSPTEIDLSWVNNATSATGILIEQSIDNVTWTTTVMLNDPTVTSYPVTGLTSGQYYNFRIAPTQ